MPVTVLHDIWRSSFSRPNREVFCLSFARYLAVPLDARLLPVRKNCFNAVGPIHLNVGPGQRYADFSMGVSLSAISIMARYLERRSQSSS